MEKSIFEALGGTYTEVGEVLIPDLELSSVDAACLCYFKCGSPVV